MKTRTYIVIVNGERIIGATISEYEEQEEWLKAFRSKPNPPSKTLKKAFRKYKRLSQ